MKTNPTYRVWFVFLIALFLLCACNEENKKEVYWSIVGEPLVKWQRTKEGVITNGDSSLYRSGSAWELVWNDSVSGAIESVCWMAPDSMQFELLLNGASLVRHKDFYLWPSSFSKDEIVVYPNTCDVRPFVIDTAHFKKALKPSGNKLVLKIARSGCGDEMAQDCGLFISTTTKSATNKQIIGTKKYIPSKLPCVFIDTKEFQIHNEEKDEAVMQIRCGENADSYCEEFSRNIKIEVRGFSSSNFPKKQYSFKMAGDTLKKEKVALLGMNAAKRWILQGPYADPSQMRNALVYDTWRKLGYWAANTRYVELVLDNNYQGVYLLMERVEATKARLDIASGDTLHEPFLVQLNRAGKGDTIIRAGEHSFILYPTPRKKTSDKAYQQSTAQQMQQLMTATQQPLQSSEVDWNSFADYVLMQELFKNMDAYYVSSYFYGNGTKIYAGPVWDFDLSIGASSILGGKRSDGWVYEANKNAIPDFWEMLVGNKEFQLLMKERYQLHRKSGWQLSSIHATIDSLVASIGHEAADRNFCRYPVLGLKKLHTYSNVPPSYEAEIIAIKQWLEKRLAWMDAQYQSSK